MTSEKAYRIVLAGDAAVGKSSFLLRLCKNEFKLSSSATLGECGAPTGTLKRGESDPRER